VPLKNAKDLAPGRWPGILRSAGLSESSLSGRHGPCPVCGGKDRFRFADKGRGQFFCQPCGHGDGWKLLQGVLGCDFRGAADFVLHHFSEDPVLPARKAPADEPRQARSLRRARPPSSICSVACRDWYASLPAYASIPRSSTTSWAMKARSSG